MNFDLTEEQARVREAARAFARREIEPRAAELDRLAGWPTEIVARLGELGWLGVAVPAEHGGAGRDHVSTALVIEEISAACAGTGAIVAAANALFCGPILRHGTAEQKRELLAPAAAGKVFGAAALSAPPHAVLPVAEAQGDGSFVLRGRAAFVVGAAEAEHVLVLAASPEGHGERRPTVLVVHRGAAGVAVSPPDEKMGLRAARTCALSFEGVRVPASHVLGGEGRGLEVAATARDAGRTAMAALAVGIARAALEKASARIREHQALSREQSIQFLLSDMAVDVDAARLLALRAARLADVGAPHGAESAMAKLFASEAATRVAHRAMQIFGGDGYTAGHGVERHYRDARITEIDEGTSEIQRSAVASSVLGG